MTGTRKAPTSYAQARAIILLLGLTALTVIGGVMWIRGVEPVEVSATIFFIPLFVAIVLFGIPGGLVLAAMASIAYVTMRIPSIQAVGFGSLAGLLVSRVVGYFAFGVIGGWATASLERSIKKLELVDRVDDETLLHNARAFVEQVEHERSRAGRYDGTFSTILVSFDNPDLDRRSRTDLMQSLGTHLRANVRAVDEITHARDNGSDLLGFVLPETGLDGARIFVEKLEATLRTILPEAQHFETNSATFPPDGDDLDHILSRFRAIHAREHPLGN